MSNLTAIDAIRIYSVASSSLSRALFALKDSNFSEYVTITLCDYISLLYSLKEITNTYAHYLYQEDYNKETAKKMLSVLKHAAEQCADTEKELEGHISFELH